MSNTTLTSINAATYGADLMERQELYRQICEQIWNPDRLLADN